MDHAQTQPQDQFDVLVVGAGPAGLMAAEQAARAGMRVAVRRRCLPRRENF